MRESWQVYFSRELDIERLCRRAGVAEPRRLAAFINERSRYGRLLAPVSRERAARVLAAVARRRLAQHNHPVKKEQTS